MANRKCHFKDEWLDRVLHPDLFWLNKVDSDNTKGYCSFCCTKFNLGNMGIPAVRSHVNSKKHENLVKAKTNNQPLNLNLKNQRKQNLTEKNNNSVSTSYNKDENETDLVEQVIKKTSSLSHFMIKNETVRAEIIWSLLQVSTKSSVRCFSVAADAFKLMFTDSEIAKKFQMHKDKLSYSITYGLGPFFQQELSSSVKLCHFYSISFDESLNKVAQKGQPLDPYLIVRFWNEGKVKTRYLTSVFLGHATAENLLLAFISGIEQNNLDIKKMIHVSMDGPNVNLKFIKDLKIYLKDSPDEAEILETGTCSLHIVNGAYKTAHNKVDWKLQNFLNALYYLFKDFPSRRADYTSFTNSNVFPLKFCSIRWLENSNVMERANAMIPFLAEYVKAVQKKPPASENFKVIVQFISDQLLSAKLSFLVSVSVELESFLRLYQSDAPLLPFMYEDIHDLLKSLMSRIIKFDILRKATNASKLIAIDLTDEKNLITAKEFSIGFAADAVIKKTNGLKDIDILRFKNDCRTFVLQVCTTLLVVKRPLSYKLVRGVSCLSPYIMRHENLCTDRLKAALEVFVDKKRMNALDADIIYREFTTTISKKTVQNQIKTFSRKDHQLDEFLLEIFKSEEVSEKLTDFFKIVFILFHGNSSVERSFSVNKGFLVENLTENSLISQRAVHDAIVDAGGIANIEITKDMILYFKNASAKRNEVLQNKKTEEELKKREEKVAKEELKALKIKKEKVMQLAKEEIDNIDKQSEKLKKIIKK